ncbi:MAG: DUF3987 domain-containing protein [Puniceicoccales bacterium]|jgi:hypothetical protein|nr:DUF3987 domain-containing protein [Puniceicoccales bacterium]
MTLVNAIGEHSLGKKNCTFLQRINEGDFPLGSLPPDLVNLARHYRAFFNIPYAATAMTSLALFSAAVGPMAQVVNGCGRGPTPLNIWVTIVASQASGKSWLVKELDGELKKATREAWGRFKSNRREAEIKIKRLESDLKDREKIGTSSLAVDAKTRIENLQNIRPLNFMMGSCTAEALKKALAENPDHFVFQVCTEGKEVYSVMLGQKYSDRGCTNLDVWLAAKTGDFLSDTRIGRETVTVSGALNGMLLMIQKRVFEEIVNQETLDRGLFTRMFAIDPGFKRTPIDEMEAPPAPKNFFDEKLRHFLGLRLRLTEPDLSGATGEEAILEKILQNIITVQCDGSARKAFFNLHNEGLELENELLPIGLKVEGITGRWHEDAIQIAGLLALLENRQTIGMEIAGRACALVRWCKKSFLRAIVYKSTRQEEKFEKFFTILESTPHGKISRRDLIRTHHIKTELIDAMLTLYPEKFRSEIICPPKAGRPSEIICLNSANQPEL